ncbi:sorting nexin-19a [Boleophthalmus pectinirostris]|uniref:sorting nexin-19a n=1 Tax=Boleophthalmus pectinirostris TaxID=150288 RepID=UPI00242C1B07|nr:sorting nexin-19a [Boleophthalmus pectinirostris]
MALLSSLSEYLGQPRLLGCVALLSWLVLFHLLVNVWLLCLFTSFLVVLGGWLGCRALLDANSLLHLEHFLPLGKVNPPVYSPEHEWRLNHEIHSAAHKAVRDFVSSWYRTVLPEVEGEFERAVLNSMLESVMELKERARRVDRKELIQRLLEVYGCHLQSYMKAKQIQASHTKDISLWEIYSEVDTPHPAVCSDERSYSTALVNLVLHVLVPYPQMETRTGGYMVTELITCNVLLPLLHRVADPDWLNQTIVEIFTRSKAPPEMTPLPTDTLYRCPIQQESWTTCRSLSSSDPLGLVTSSLSDSEEQLSPKTPSEDSPQGSMVSIASSDKTDFHLENSIAQYNVTCCSLSTVKCSTIPQCKVPSMTSLLPSDSDYDLKGRFCDCGPSTNFCKVITLEEDEPFGCFATLKGLGPKQVVPEDSLWPAGMSQDKSPPRKFDLTLDSPNHSPAPVNIQNVHISGTTTAKEQRGTSTHLFTVYTIKFDTINESENGGAQHSFTSHTINRRYSEFLNLQTRLEEKPEMKKLLKNIKGPKKIFPDISFGNSDSEKVEARKCQLDTFLKQLSSIPETANSEDMQEFLGLNSDVCAHFGRRPVGKSRIDKMMENALDTLKTAFPYPDLSPTEDSDIDTDGRMPEIRKYRRLFQNRMSTSLNISELPPKVTYCYSASSPMLNGMTLSGLENFVKDQEQRMCSLSEKGPQELWSEQFGKNTKASGKSSTDTAVADVALNILCLLMKDQWNWLCTENIQKTIRLLFGTFIERWLDVGVAHLTSAPCWVIYLQVLQEAVWPGGTLPAQPRPERSTSQREETKERCLECLMQLIPQLVTDMLGTEKFCLSLETVLESLQDYQINKHLLYCICDLLLELLIPESCDESFQTSLLQRLGKDTEKDNNHHI